MSHRTMAFAGSFDPMTNGHVWVVERALSMADEVMIVVAVNAGKKCWFSPQARVDMIKEVAQGQGWGERVKAIKMTGQYVAPTLKSMGIQHMVRGIRSAIDFDQERLIQRVNDEVLHGAQTWFVTPPPGLDSVSSSFVKSLIGPIGWPFFIKKMLPIASFHATLRYVLYGFWLDALHQNTPERWQHEGWLGRHSEHCDHPVAASFVKLMNAYEAPERHYHSTEHLASMLAELRALALTTPEAMDPASVLACFFHDAVYRGTPAAPYWGLSDWQTEADETRSAALVTLLLPALDAPTSAAVQRAIHATMHGQQQTHNAIDAALASADLAILGQPEEIYQAYAQNIRREYADVPETLYRTKRAEVLTAMINRAKDNRLFSLADCADAYNMTAIRNMENERDDINNW